MSACILPISRTFMLNTQITEGAERRIDELEALIARTVDQARVGEQRASDLIAQQSKDIAELTDLVMKREAYIIELLA